MSPYKARIFGVKVGVIGTEGISGLRSFETLLRVRGLRPLWCEILGCLFLLWCFSAREYVCSHFGCKFRRLGSFGSDCRDGKKFMVETVS